MNNNDTTQQIFNHGLSIPQRKPGRKKLQKDINNCNMKNLWNP